MAEGPRMAVHTEDMCLRALAVRGSVQCQQYHAHVLSHASYLYAQVLDLHLKALEWLFLGPFGIHNSNLIAIVMHVPRSYQTVPSIVALAADNEHLLVAKLPVCGT